MLNKVIPDYLLWMEKNGYKQSTIQRAKQVFRRFSLFVERERILWRSIFIADTIDAFQKETGLRNISAVRGLCGYLVKEKGMAAPEDKDKRRLPEIYEEFLRYDAKMCQSSTKNILCKRRVLTALHDYLQRHKILLPQIKIEELDAYFAEYTASFSPSTCNSYRCALRGFLTYLYREKGIIKRDLASLLVGPPIYEMARPPKFLKKTQVSQLFQSIDLTGANGLRTYAICTLAYTLGLRPKEISLIRLDDISFAERTLILRERKGANPMKLPLPEQVMEAIAAYVIGGRPKSSARRLFLCSMAPHTPSTSSGVSLIINRAMRRAKITGTAYWLRHTYAQNLLDGGASIFEIKEMLGHQSIQSSKRYISIHIKLMREVMFDEIL
ncbi:MAG: tyrosine-type recombinase/integrase [bacterium]